MNEKDIMQLITKDYSWEQVLYRIIAWEGMDPWDLDISKLSRAFMQHMEKLDEVDFKVPAKYVIIAAVLLRMKSDHLHFIDWLTNPEEDAVGDGGEIEQSEQRDLSTLEINPITMPPVRYAKRKITANELVSALKKVLIMQEKRETRRIKARKLIRIEDDSISEKITKLYERINLMLDKIKQEEIKFSDIVTKWKREDVIDAFVPLIYLDHEKKVNCRQDDFFQEIFVSRPAPEPKTADPDNEKSDGTKARRLVAI